MRHLIITILVFSTLFISAQTIENQVISAAGWSFSSSSLRLDQTVGDLFIGNVAIGAIQINHGFQQYFSSNIGLNEFVSALDISVYPVPTFDYVTVSLPELLADGARLWMTTIEGRIVVLDNNPIIISRGLLTQLNLESMPAGSYFLYISHEKLKDVKIFRVFKLI